MMRRWLALSLLVCGCESTTVNVDFVVPDGIDGLVASTRLSVIEHNEMTCDDIAWRRVDELAVRAATTVQFTLRQEDSLTMAGVPRLGRKLFLVEAFDTSDQLVAAGCTPFGDIDGGVIIAVVGEPASVLEDLASPGVGQTIANPISVRVSSARDEPLSDTPLAWLAKAGAASETGGEVRTDAGGRADVTIEAPGYAGPGVIDVRARWQRGDAVRREYFCEPAPLLDGEPVDRPMLGSNYSETSDQPEIGFYAAGGFGPNGRDAFAVLGPRYENALQQIARPLVVRWAGTEVAHIFDSGVTVLGSYRASEQADRLVAGGNNELFLVSVGDAIAVEPRVVSGGQIAVLQPAGACDGGREDLLVTMLDGHHLIDTASFGQSPFAVTTPGNWFPVASGCVDDVDRLVVFDLVNDARMLISSGDREQNLPFLKNVLASFSDRQLLLPDQTLDGTGIARYRVEPSGDASLITRLVDRSGTPFLPTALTSGDFDGDTLPDIAALIPRETADEPGRLLIMILGQLHDGDNIRALRTSSDFSFAADQLFAADLDDDGVDDLVVAGADKYVAIRMGDGYTCP